MPRARAADPNYFGEVTLPRPQRLLTRLPGQILLWCGIFLACTRPFDDHDWKYFSIVSPVFLVGLSLSLPHRPSALVHADEPGFCSDRAAAVHVRRAARGG
jgi:hypothetical protein